jgi:hypothetical protein
MRNLRRKDIASLRDGRLAGSAVLFFGDLSVSVVRVENMEPHAADNSKLLRDDWIWASAQADARTDGRPPYSAAIRDRFNTAFAAAWDWADRALPRPLPVLTVVAGARLPGAPPACGTLPAGLLVWCTLTEMPVWPARCVSVPAVQYAAMREAARAEGRGDATEPVMFFGDDDYACGQTPMLVELTELSAFLAVPAADGRNPWIEHMRLRSVAAARVRGERGEWDADMWVSWETACEMAQDCALALSLEPLTSWLAPPGAAGGVGGGVLARVVNAGQIAAQRTQLVQPPPVVSMRIGGAGGVGTLVPAIEPAVPPPLVSPATEPVAPVQAPAKSRKRLDGTGGRRRKTHPKDPRPRGTGKEQAPAAVADISTASRKRAQKRVQPEAVANTGSSRTTLESPRSKAKRAKLSLTERVIVAMAGDSSPGPSPVVAKPTAKAKTKQSAPPAKRMSRPKPKMPRKPTARTNGEPQRRLEAAPPRNRRSSVLARRTRPLRPVVFGETIVISDSDDDDDDADAVMLRSRAKTRPSANGSGTLRPPSPGLGVAYIPRVPARAPSEADESGTRPRAVVEKDIGPVVLSVEQGLVDIYEEYGC